MDVHAGGPRDEERHQSLCGAAAFTVRSTRTIVRGRTVFLDGKVEGEPGDGWFCAAREPVKTLELVEIDERRLLRRLDELAQRGTLPGGGLYRPLYSPAWVAATEMVHAWMKDGGLFTRRDAVGNVWGRIEGSRGGRAIVTGSHIDTVRGGGALTERWALSPASKR